jgi:hypothetical protein
VYADGPLASNWPWIYNHLDSQEMDKKYEKVGVW